MKKLLILAVLALGLCAAPAMAVTIDFTDDAFYLSGGDLWYLGLPTSLYFHDGEYDPNFNAWYRTADGLSIDLAGGDRAYVNFSGHNPRIKDLTISVIGQEVIWTLTPHFLIDAVLDPGLVVLDPADTHAMWFSIDDPVESLLFMNYGNSPLTLTLASIEFKYGSSAVPVPAAVWLLGTGVAGVAALRRKFK